MTEANFAVDVQNVCKNYRLWNAAGGRLISPLKHFLPAHLSAKWQPSYREFCALKNISFTICKGESWGFIGVNGSGKSTLLKMISGNLRPSAGRIIVDGRTVILDYSSGLNGELTGKENIYLKATLLGLTRKQIKERYQAIIAFADLGDFINQPVRTYSSGMVSRLGFSIVAHVDADIIITDEALAVGDRFFVKKCMQFIGDFLKRGTFLFVSHSMSDVLSFCQKAIWLEEGAIKLMGTAATVTQAYLEKAQREEKQDQTAAEDEDAKDPQIIVLGPSESASSLSPLPTLPTLPPGRVGDSFFPSPLGERVGGGPLFKADGKESGGAEILATTLTNQQHEPCSRIIGGEVVNLQIDVKAGRDLYSPVTGFQILDRLGQILCAHNSFLTVREQPYLAKSTTIFSVKFTFHLPLLPSGDYIIRAFVALATPEMKVEMLHIVNNAMVLHSVTTGARHGLVGIPMLGIQFKYKEVKESYE